MDVINESLTKSLIRTSNIYYDLGGQYQSSKSAENRVFSNLEFNFCKTMYDLGSKKNIPSSSTGQHLLELICLVFCKFHDLHFVTLRNRAVSIPFFHEVCSVCRQSLSCSIYADDQKWCAR